MRNSPSCVCCVDCDIAVISDLDTAPSGSWSSDGPPITEYSTSSGSALRHTTLTSDSDPWKVACVITFNLSSGNDQEAGIIGGLSDSSNFMYAGMRLIWDGTLSMWTVQFVMGQVASGVFTELVQHPLLPYHGISGAVTQITYELSMCWDGDQLTGMVAEQNASHIGDIDITSAWDTDILSANGVTPPGSKAGIGTRTMEAGSVDFGAFEFVRTAEVGCEAICYESCCDGPSPDELLIELSGGTGYHTITGTGPGDKGDVRVNVSEFNATHIVPYAYIFSSGRYLNDDGVGGTAGGAHGGDGRCTWGLEFEIDAEYHDGTTWQPCVMRGRILVTIEPTGSTFMFEDNVTIMLSLATVPGLGGDRCNAKSDTNVPATTGGFVTFNGPFTSPCEDWTDWIDADVSGSPSSPWDTLSCRFMKN